MTGERLSLAIVGGGPVGMALALALERHVPRSVALSLFEVKARADVAKDARTLALSHGSRLILERLGVDFDAIGATAITSIHVSQRGAFGRTLLSAQESGVPALGYTVSYAQLAAALQRRIEAAPIDYLTATKVTALREEAELVDMELESASGAGRSRAQIVAVADGGRGIAGVTAGAARERDYGQWALSAQVSTEVPHGGRAYERFTDHGPMALLPVGERMALVWCDSAERTQARLELAEDAFLRALHEQFGDRAGAFFGLGTRTAFALKLRYSANNLSGRRVVLVGNAAQTLHPVAGQGFNLGLRDAWQLSELLRTAAVLQWVEALAKFRAARAWDRRIGIGFTDVLIRTFSTANPVLGLSRSIGLAALDALPPARRALARSMIFGVSPP